MDNVVKNIIFDTDAGSDCDDMMALGYLIQRQKENKINIKAVTYSHVSPHGAAAIRATFRYFGEAVPPVGVMVDGNPFDDHYTKGIDERFANDEERVPAEPAAVVLRRALVQCEGKAIICAVGPLTNIAALLCSEPDDISPLGGVGLVKEKCEKLVLMAGEFTPNSKGELNAEWNVKCDIPAARSVADLSPVPIAWLPFETGWDMITGKTMMEKYGEASPISLAFKLYPWAKEGRHSWDPATALYAIEGCGKFFVERHGRVSVDENGVTRLQCGEDDGSCVLFMDMDSCCEKDIKNRAAAYLDAVVMKLHEKEN